MNNSDKPAMPVQFADWNGLTKREYFAGLAMQGLMSGIQEDTEWNFEEYSSTAVGMADALLKELDK